MSEQKARTHLMHRRLGMSLEKKAELAVHNANKADWWAKCRLCGERLYGTLEELEGHKCHARP